jgi:hypothetical protein
MFSVRIHSYSQSCWPGLGDSDILKNPSGRAVERLLNGFGRVGDERNEDGHIVSVVDDWLAGVAVDDENHGRKIGSGFDGDSFLDK